MKRSAVALFCALCGCAGAAMASAAVQERTVVYLSIDDAVRRSLDYDPSLKAHAAAIDAANGAVRQAASRPNPELGIEAENLGGNGAYSGFGRAEYTLILGQKIERGGKRDARRTLAQSEVEWSRLNLDVGKLDLVRQVQQAYIDILADEAEIATARARVQQEHSLLQAVRNRVQAARDPLSALRRAEGRVIEAETALTQAEAARDLAARKIVSFWGGADSNFVVHAEDLYALPAATEYDLPAASPDLQILAARRKQADAAYALEKSQVKQDPVISAGVRRFAEGRDAALMVGLSIPLPVFNANRGNIEKARAERVQAEYEQVAAERALSREVMVARSDLLNSRSEALAIRDQMLPKAEDAAKLSRQGYEAGAFSYLDVIDAQRNLVEVREKLIASLKSFHSARVAYERLTAQYFNSVQENGTIR